MNLFGRLKVGFSMAWRSTYVVRDHPRLLVFPLLGGLSGIAFLLTLFGGLFVSGPVFEEAQPALLVALFLAYLVETFVASFFAAALVAATRTTFDGDEPAIRPALAAAWAKKRQLLVWSIIAAVIGVIIRALESEDNLVTSLAAVVFAVAWSVMTYFVIPVIVFRDPSVRGMFKESAHIFTDTWGESIGAMAAINVATGLLALVGVLIGGVTFVALTGFGTVRLAATVIVGGSAVVVGVLVGKTLTGIAKTALYLYATENTAPDHFEDIDFEALGGDRTARQGVLGGRI